MLLERSSFRNVRDRPEAPRDRRRQEETRSPEHTGGDRNKYLLPFPLAGIGGS
jgi:hypothetical protein